MKLSNCTGQCGDGIIVYPEYCDDGILDDRGCSNDCTMILPGYVCIVQAAIPNSVCQSVCPQSPSSNCFDGNLVSGDGCSSTCSVEDGWECKTDSTGSQVFCEKDPIASIISVD